MVNNWEPYTDSKLSLCDLELEPFIGDTVFYYNKTNEKYQKAVILEKTGGFINKTYICKIKDLKNDIHHYKSTEYLFINDPGEPEND